MKNYDVFSRIFYFCWTYVCLLHPFLVCCHAEQLILRHEEELVLQLLQVHPNLQVHVCEQLIFTLNLDLSKRPANCP
jgi:hypothetical protein